MFRSIFKHKWWVIFLLAILVVVGIVGYQKSQVKPTYTTLNPEFTDLTESLSVSGVVDAIEKVNLNFALPARLTWVGVKEGQQVKKYQAIASIDSSTLKKQLQISLNNFSKQFITHDRTLAQYDYYNNPTIDLELKRILEQAQYDLNNSVVQVELADLAVKLQTISTPIAGIVTHVAQPFSGVTVSAADVFQIVNPNTIYFSVIVDEADISKVLPQQQVKVILDAFPEESFLGTVNRIDFTSSVSESGGTGYKVYITLPQANSEMKFKLGMNGTAEVALNTKNHILTIPVDSLISRDNKNYVDVLENGKTVRKEVVIGIETDTAVEVVSGLTQKDLVILPKAL